MNDAPSGRPVERRRAFEVFRVALVLGVTAFGGPIAHVGYFEHAYVRRRRWLTEAEFAELLALCQAIPGPASSQLGFLIGLHRAGYWGALAAWLGFTLPSAVILFAAAGAAARLNGPYLAAVIHGLEWVAVAVVAQAVWAMARRLWSDAATAAIGVAAGGLALFGVAPQAPLLTLGVGAVFGAVVCRAPAASGPPGASVVGRRVALTAGAALVALLLGLPLLAARDPHGSIALADVFFRAGALVFGGGHVVLPLLHGPLVSAGWLSEDAFLAGYGIAQAVPGPLFTVAAYFGAGNLYVDPPLWGAAVAVIAIFLPGLLLALAAAALWKTVAAHAWCRRALMGVNAAVVGLLAAALWNPIVTTSVHSLADGLAACAAVLLLQRFRVPPPLVALLCVATSLTMRVWR